MASSTGLLVVSNIKHLPLVSSPLLAWSVDEPAEELPPRDSRSAALTTFAVSHTAIETGMAMLRLGICGGILNGCGGRGVACVGGFRHPVS